MFRMEDYFMEIKGAIFDLDGTLIDSTWIWNKIDCDFLGKRGFDVPEDYVYHIAPLGAKEIAIYTKDRFNLEESINDIMKEWYDMAIDAYSNEIILKPGAYEYLKYLYNKGIKLAIATASDMCLVEPVLKRNKILDLFENITTIKEVTRGKGHPDIYLLAAKKMGLKSNECVVYEDIIQGVTGSKSGGFYTIAVNDNHSDEYRRKLVNIADKYINNFDELCKQFV